MNPKKPYSPTQRKAIDTAGDPYLLKNGGYDMAVCKKCHAIYYNKRWYLNEGMYQQKVKQKATVKTLCPACLKIRDKFPGGIVTLTGEFLKTHKEEIINLIKNEEQRARGFNPLERIMEMSEIKGGGIKITTTNEKLAQRIGRSLQRAYQGRVDYKWAQDTKLLRVEWVR